MNIRSVLASLTLTALIAGAAWPAHAIDATISLAQAPGSAPLAAAMGDHSGHMSPAVPPMSAMMNCPMMSGMMGQMSAVKVPYGGNAEAARAFAQANMKMHQEMDIAFSGNPDRDFAAGMIPHHQGAIDMAKIVQQYGKDPEIRKLAEEIIAAQEKEIAFMKAWLARQPQ